MCVYVDDMEAEFKPKHRPGVTYILCHMIADTEEELHAMADRIGLDRKWYQGDHYDVGKTKKILAIKSGARLITWRQAGAMMRLKRNGLPMGDPATAVNRIQAIKF